MAAEPRFGEPASFRPGTDDLGRRLDRVARALLPHLSLSNIYAAIRTGGISINGRKASLSYRIAAGDLLLVARRLLLTTPPGEGPKQKRTSFPAWLASAILFENEHLLVVNKPKGVVVHGHASLDEAVAAYLAAHIPTSLSFRPGPLHRIDRETSGIVVFGKSLAGAQEFSARLREGRIRKSYLGLVDGIIPAAELWEDSVVRDSVRKLSLAAGGEEAGGSSEARRVRTRVVPLFKTTRYSLCLMLPLTGRTHQIRVQAAIHGHPLAGDQRYRGSSFAGGYLLHAWELGFDPSFTAARVGRIVAKPPAPFLEAVASLIGKAAVDSLLTATPFPFQADQSIIGG